MATAPEAVPLPITDQENTKPRRWKKVKGGEHLFNRASPQPSNGSGDAETKTDGQKQAQKRSFKDTVIGAEPSTMKEDGEDDNFNDCSLDFSEEMFDGRIIIEETTWGKHECPNFKLSKWEEARIQKPWRKGLIVNLLGRKIGFRALESRLNQLWVSAGSINIIDLGKDYYLVTFSSEKDRDFALSQGPWLIYDHYLIVREWCPNFHPDSVSIDRVAVWVRFSGLPIEYYDPSFLNFVDNKIGRTVKVDKTTLQHDRGKYARLCVEVDLQQPLLAVFLVNGQKYKVEYEGLHLLCLKCGKFGHYREACPMVEENSEMPKEGTDMNDKNDDASSMWTVVQKSRPNHKKKPVPTKLDNGMQSKSKGGSRYSVLNNAVEDPVEDTVKFNSATKEQEYESNDVESPGEGIDLVPKKKQGGNLSNSSNSQAHTKKGKSTGPQDNGDKNVGPKAVY